MEQWTPFYLEVKNLKEEIKSRKEWETFVEKCRLRRGFLRRRESIEETVARLEEAQSSELFGEGMHFGLWPCYDSEPTLGTWAKEQGMDLSIKTTQ